MADSKNQTVRAAGGVVARSGPAGVEVALVHRPRYEDWSLPKGKLKPGESEPDAALREVAEETGLTCALGHELASVLYSDALGRPKSVRFWAMRVLNGEFAPNDEVDELRWLAPAAALDLLSYERDCRVLRSFGHDPARPPLLVRHAAAVKRGEWAGDDRLRPLGGRGLRQAAGLVDVLAGHAVERIVSSPYVRCLQTVVPLAAARGLEVELREELAEGAGAAGLRAIGPAPGTVVCVHGDLVADVLGAGLPKASTTLLDLPSLAAIATIPPPE